MSEKMRIKEIEGCDTTGNIFTVCGNECGEFFGCTDQRGKYRPCTTCGFAQKFTCAGVVDRLTEEQKLHQTIKQGKRCEFCPPEIVDAHWEPVAQMSD